MKEESIALFLDAQEKICRRLEEVDGKAKFISDKWVRPDELESHGGGGLTRVLSGGDVLERAGVNFSEVFGTLNEEMSKRLISVEEVTPFFATGISLVLHPCSPLIPTTHANFRYLEVGDRKWFGGGSDLTPYYLFEEDAKHFHQVLKDVCDRYSDDYYPKFKKECDEYFYLPHRGEGRGVGGLFFDYLGKEDPSVLQSGFELVRDLSQSFLSSYVPIMERRMSEPWTEQQKKFQLMRRGRYVEFNLLYDRGTQFGLNTNGRVESILMSLPPLVTWEYDYKAEPSSPEAELLEVLKSPREWVAS